MRKHYVMMSKFLKVWWNLLFSDQEIPDDNGYEHEDEARSGGGHRDGGRVRVGLVVVPITAPCWWGLCCGTVVTCKRLKAKWEIIIE